MAGPRPRRVGVSVTRLAERLAAEAGADQPRWHWTRPIIDDTVKFMFASRVSSGALDESERDARRVRG